MIFEERYDCIYKAEGVIGDSLEELNTKVKVNLGHYACFSSIYSRLRTASYARVTYDIYLYKNNLAEKNFNLCDKLETKKILRCLQKTVPFTYKFSTATYKISNYSKENTDYNVLTVSITGNYAQHLWVTSMLRCFFEWPYNIAAKEACELQSKLKIVDDLDLSKENWINLYLTIAAQLGSYDLHGVVDYSGLHPKAKTYKEWEQQLKSIKGSPRIIDALRKGGHRFDRKKSVQINVYNQTTLDEGTKSRASKYVAAYKDKLSWKKK